MDQNVHNYIQQSFLIKKIIENYVLDLAPLEIFALPGMLRYSAKSACHVFDVLKIYNLPDGSKEKNKQKNTGVNIFYDKH